jgi:hypothetical protein
MESTAIAILMHGKDTIRAEIKKEHVDLARDRIKKGCIG